MLVSKYSLKSPLHNANIASVLRALAVWLFQKFGFFMDCPRTYNLTSRRVRATNVAVENHNYYVFLVCVRSRSYPARNAHAPYCHLWPVRLYHIFPQYLINSTIFEKKIIEYKSVFWFCLQLLSETFLILRRFGRDTIIIIHVSPCTVPAILVRF
jgi:hypothetical protein